MQQPHIVSAFEPGARAKDPTEGEIIVWTRTLLDELKTPTGRIVACDPFYCSDTPPFTVRVPAGSYPVILCVAQFAHSSEERIAAAMVRLQSGPAIRWEVAIFPSEQEREEKGTPPTANGVDRVDGDTEEALSDYTYCVDSGFGSFMDQAAVDVFLEQVKAANADDKQDEWDAAVDYLQQRIDEMHPSGGPEWFNIVLDEPSGANMLIFTSGWGDGGYASYWGLDGRGNPVCLITDFGIFEDAEWIQ